MKEFESDLDAERYFRGVLCYGPDWSFSAKPSRGVQGTRVASFRRGVALSLDYYILKPAAQQFPVIVKFLATAESQQEADKQVMRALHNTELRTVPYGILGGSDAGR